MMLTENYFRILSTAHPGMRPSVTFWFKKPERAASILRFYHASRNGAQLHIFADKNSMPLAVQFRMIPIDELEEISPLSDSPKFDAEELRPKMYAFAQMMIAYSQLEESADCAETEGHWDNCVLRAPNLPVVERFFDQANDIAYTEVV